METRERWHQLWGTCSVKDHKLPGAFVAEVLLYDKLLIPVPPTLADGVSAEDVESERERWSKHWDPERQKRMLEILGDRADAIPWTAERQVEWQKCMEAQVADARRDGYFATGTVLQRFAPVMARSVVAVSQYHSVAELNKGARIRRVEPHERLPGSSLMAVLGYELLLPDDPEQDDDDFKLLRDAVKVACDGKFREKRRALYDWQQDFLSAEGETDAASIESAVTEMKRLVDEMTTATERQRKWKWAKKFFSFSDAASKCSKLIPGVGAFGLAADAVISLGKFATEEGVEANKVDRNSIPAASLILELREKLEIEER